MPNHTATSLGSGTSAETFRVWPDRVVLTNREKEEVINASGVGAFAFAFIVVAFLAIAFVIVFVVNSWYLAAACPAIVGSALLVALAKGGFRTRRRGYGSVSR
jgi:hypothetical protein